ncbi:hypothetical protein [Parasphingorhabdus sp.]|uniref:hypothetical protein n=1 Tax=Parasphingorhabdus sp. TaxID=2709688 RepID=UPI003A8E6940
MLIPGDTYEVRAVTRSVAGDIIWRTKTGHVVDLSSSNYDAGALELAMVDVSAQSGISALFGDAWIVEDINGGGIIDSSNSTRKAKSPVREAVIIILAIARFRRRPSIWLAEWH